MRPRAWSREISRRRREWARACRNARSDFGPGYRIYFGRDGDALVILLGGGTKKGQNKDIQTAQERWNDYKRRKRKESSMTLRVTTKNENGRGRLT